MDKNEPALRRKKFFFHLWKIGPGLITGLFRPKQVRSSEIKRDQVFGTKSDAGKFDS
jgi:hypothetical protein